MAWLLERVRETAADVTLQREAVMEIQHALEARLAANSEPPGGRLSDQFRAAATEPALHLRAHIARLEDRELATSVLEWLEPRWSEAAARTALDSLQDRLSHYLRGLYARRQ
ncbi:hypothetical protein [Streptomyces sp. Rer75]|uniref:hypothetical protein n=1 Tax=unclassified Streptomyces TaxID=2593676 RepID=UPI0015D032BF|nr:hypothetical protein [Streptomyces sp. Rer75]QLH25515.1 hypothetical protein HYQ63_36950 [Streptomyces sp. Rer75]